MTVSLPMYPFSPQTMEAFWQRLKAAIPSPSLPATLSWPAHLLPHWQRTDLLLSQTCGFPLMTTLPDVQVVGAFLFSAPGCEEANYRSWLVVREDGQDVLEQFRGEVLAFNSSDSQSGYHSIMKMTGGPAFFSRTVASGGHRSSVALLRRGEADIAAIDCISWALLLRDFPQELRGLKIIGQTASVPGLPLITSAQTPATTVEALRNGLRKTVADPANSSLLSALMITGFTVLPREEWQVIFN